MNKEKTSQLVKRYPELFVRHDWPKRTSGMCYGFQCGDGWFDIINDLCNCIMEVCERNRIPAPEVECVKEKFAGLRFYLDVPFTDPVTDEAVYKFISKIEAHSFYVCEACGRDGELATTGCWVKTLCNQCLVQPDYQHMRRLPEGE